MSAVQGAGQRTAVFPGSFDPPTYGHLDLLDRALDLFGSVVIAIGKNSDKRSLFEVEERIALLEACVTPGAQVKVRSFDGLLVDWCRREGLGPIVRGVRNGLDFEYERAMALHNRTMAPEVDTVFLMPRAEHSFTSSSLLREIVRAGGDARPWLPAPVLAAMHEKASRG